MYTVTHTHTHIYIYIYMCVCVWVGGCVGVCIHTYSIPSKFGILGSIESLGRISYEIRNPRYVLPKFKNEFMQKSFHHDLIVIIHNTPSLVIDKIYTHSIQSLALYIKQYVLDFYSNIICLIDNCYVCSRHRVILSLQIYYYK